MSVSTALGAEHEVELPQGRIRYRERGDGPPVIFAHGLLVNGDLWRKVVPLLADGERLGAMGAAATGFGIRNGDEIVKPVPQDGIQADQKATLTLRVARGGEVLDVTYLPRGETVAVPQWVAVSPSCQAASRTASSSWRARRPRRATARPRAARR